MARGGKRKGAGRKPTGKVAMLVRVRPEVRRRLERDAKRARRSLSSEVERQLEDAFRAVERADPPTRALCYLISQIPWMADLISTTQGGKSFISETEMGSYILTAPGVGIRWEPFNWRTNRLDFLIAKEAINRILDWLAPRGTIEGSEGPTPEQIGGAVARALFGYLLARPDDLYTFGDKHWGPRGSLFYAMPQAARDLGLHIGKADDQATRSR